MSAGVSVAGIVDHFVEAVKLLGVSRVTLDSALTFNQHVTDVHACTYHTCALRHIFNHCKCKGRVKKIKIFAFSVPFGKFSFLCRTPNSVQGGRFCAKFYTRNITTQLY